jgi:CspA family cold shock protein
MMGTVANWNSDRAYGFIKRDDGQPDIFAHVTQLSGGMSDLVPGDRVSFEVEPGRNGKLQATAVRVIDGAAVVHVFGNASGDAKSPGAVLTETAPRFGD